ncbi:GntR family transcriptional regulator [Amycolatopsis sp. cmx-4-83]|uniref:GntR family transcriptional regulator n=1 Tax=Amycolatopsis sp. cmx-4-83 TaxID=2790940 RepID=UPI003978C829
MRPPIQRIESRSVTELVTAELRRSIVAGDLAPGEPFSLRRVAEMLDVSFIPVREAVRNLESEGLIITRPGRSAIVAPLDLEDLQAIYRLRRTLEPELAARSCRVISVAELDRLAAQAVDFGDARHTIQTVYDSHHEFHAALLAPAASPWDVRLMNLLWRAAERYIRIGFGSAEGAAGDNHRHQRAHEDLLDVFRGRDPVAVREAVLVHLTHNEESALAALRKATVVVEGQGEQKGSA